MDDRCFQRSVCFLLIISFHAGIAVLNVLFLEVFALSEIPKLEVYSATQEPILVFRVDVHFFSAMEI